MTCSYERCENLVEGRTRYCASHNAMMRKIARDLIKKEQQKKIPKAKKTKFGYWFGKRISKKRADALKAYRKRRQWFLSQNPHCAVKLHDCKYIASQVHHQLGREGDLLNNEPYWLPICDPCHRFITTHSNWAIINGFSIRRTSI